MCPNAKIERRPSTKFTARGVIFYTTYIPWNYVDPPCSRHKFITITCFRLINSFRFLVDGAAGLVTLMHKPRISLGYSYSLLALRLARSTLNMLGFQFEDSSSVTTATKRQYGRSYSSYNDLPTIQIINRLDYTPPVHLLLFPTRA